MCNIIKYMSLVSYIGSKYLGSQRNLARKISLDNYDPIKCMTIQNILDFALETILPKPLATAKLKNDKPANIDNIDNNNANNDLVENYIGYRTFMTSRTDSGVNSFCNLYIYYLKHPENKIYKPSDLTLMLNKYLIENKHEIIVNKTIIVDKDFNFNYLNKFKTYIYRLAILRPELNLKDGLNGLIDENVNLAPHLIYQNNQVFNNHLLYSYLPINELYRCTLLNSNLIVKDENNNVVQKKFCLDKLKESSQLCINKHNFLSFTSRFQYKDEDRPESESIRTIKYINLKFRNLGDLVENDLKYKNFFWLDLEFKGDGFLYKQIRKMVSVFVYCAFDLIKIEDVKFMLEKPDSAFFKYPIAPSNGLFLKEIQISDYRLKNDD